ncbi:hypothetical protein BVX95_00220 [archaeon D22]|nr:hypothetical protein BVX95_00220 [archaeon D22]
MTPFEVVQYLTVAPKEAHTDFLKAKSCISGGISTVKYYSLKESLNQRIFKSFKLTSIYG